MLGFDGGGKGHDRREGGAGFPGELSTVGGGAVDRRERFVEQVARSERKLIVNISSVMGSIAENGGGHYIYRSSKAALNMVTRGLAADLADRGITAVSLHPGWVQTDMGGENAAVTPPNSVAGMRRVIERLTTADSGGFFRYDGAEIAW